MDRLCFLGAVGSERIVFIESSARAGDSQLALIWEPTNFGQTLREEWLEDQQLSDWGEELRSDCPADQVASAAEVVFAEPSKFRVPEATGRLVDLSAPGPRVEFSWLEETIAAMAFFDGMKTAAQAPGLAPSLESLSTLALRASSIRQIVDAVRKDVPGAPSLALATFLERALESWEIGSLARRRDVARDVGLFREALLREHLYWTASSWPPQLLSAIGRAMRHAAA